MNLIRTSCQLEPATVQSLKQLYPTLTLSEIIRLCMSFTLTNKPNLVQGKTILTLENTIDTDTIALVVKENSQ